MGIHTGAGSFVGMSGGRVVGAALGEGRRSGMANGGGWWLVAFGPARLAAVDHTVQICVVEGGILELCVDQPGAGETGASEAGSPQVGSGEVGLTEIGMGEVGVGEIGIGEIGLA